MSYGLDDVWGSFVFLQKQQCDVLRVAMSVADARTTALRLANQPNASQEFVSSVVRDFLTGRQFGFRESAVRAGLSALGSSRELLFECLKSDSYPEETKVDLLKFIGLCGGRNEAMVLGRIFRSGSFSDRLKRESLTAMAAIGGPTVCKFLLDFLAEESDSLVGLQSHAGYLYEELVSASSGVRPFRFNRVSLFNFAEFHDTLHELGQMDSECERQCRVLLSETAIFGSP